MPKIFELFGYPLNVNTVEAQICRKQAKCPFMGAECDGGGNRYASHVHLENNEELKNFFENQTAVPSGVCSIQLKESEAPWIVCPRRLLVLGRGNLLQRANQQGTENQVISLLDYPKGTRIGVWSEVKLQIGEETDEGQKSFQYTFDYVLMPIGSVDQNKIEEMLGVSWSVIRRTMEKVGYTIARRNGLDFVEDFPISVPNIIEIMTSSTSGGNKLYRTTIPQAFEDAILGKDHVAPSINKRQVWARMVSQLIVKSEVALHWGGKALWLIQDNLADYISSSTALNLQKFIASKLSEVNLLSFSYGNLTPNHSGIIELELKNIFSGPISSNDKDSAPSFSDLIRTPLLPEKNKLISRLIESKPVNQIQI
ncbi:MAG: hypothetical protein HUU34_16245 [Saprospiraceae bacterium]|nr:hypothetical protein [Saprospiraceae bacterium]